MEIKAIQFSEIVPDTYNPRKELTADDIEFERIRKSLEEFGYVEPIVFNRQTGHIVGGHQRISVMKSMGMTEAEMSVVDLDEKEEKLLNLRLNKIKGRWDYDKLEELLSGFTIDEALLTGFGSEELAVMLAKGDDIDEYMEDFDDGDGYDDYDEEDDDFEGASWVVTLKFPAYEDAEAWCEKRGYLGAAKEGKATTVIRIGMR